MLLASTSIATTSIFVKSKRKETTNDARVKGSRCTSKNCNRRYATIKKCERNHAFRNLARMLFENSEFVLANYMAVPEQTNKEKQRRRTQRFCISCLFLKHAFRNLARMFLENWEFVLAH
jgi:hypothetical protein